MEKYRKAIVAAAGIVVLFVPDLAGLEGSVGTLFDTVVAVLTVFGVFQVRNAPSEPFSRRRSDVVR